jgi:hypothetical protein
MKIPFLLLFALIIMSSHSYASQIHEKRAPFATFIMIHFEVGGDQNFEAFQDVYKKELKSGYKADTRSLDYQRALWPTSKELVQEADRHNFKLTLAFNPQWAEYILQDDRKIEDVRKWISNGHELAFQHHGINHIDWNGYTNQSSYERDRNRQRFVDKLKTGNYRGNADEGFGWLKKLAAMLAPNYRIITGTVTDTAKDKPQEIIIVTKGSLNFENDLRSKPSKQQLPGGQTIFWVKHYNFRSNFNTARDPDLYTESQSLEKAEQELERIKLDYAHAGNDEIVGVVFHDFDYYRIPQVYKAFFEYLASNNQRVTTIRAIVKQYNDERSIEARGCPEFCVNGIFSVAASVHQTG